VNDAESCKMLARYLWEGEEVPHDFREARRLWRIAAVSGDGEAMECYANVCRDGPEPDHEESLAFYRRGANEHGRASCMTNVGLALSRGMGTKADLVEARTWYEKAAARGDVNAISNIGNIYFEGRGVPQDLPRALVQYERAAAHGHTQATLNCGLILCAGVFVPEDRERGMAFLKAAADHDDCMLQAVMSYAKELVLGRKRGFPQLDEAEVYFRKAVEMGDASAAAALAKLPALRLALRAKGVPNC